MTFSELDSTLMQLAYEQATLAMGLSSPNPRVGCVVVRAGEVIGRGHTQAVGQAHAEVMAIRDAQTWQADLAGCTVYVTLEPCCHFGRTPPCVDALKAISPARVVVACLDVNPKVKGQGVAALREAGVVVDVMALDEPMAQKAWDLNIGFMQRMAYQKVYARMKWAATLDGKTALNDGRSQWITQSAARDDGQYFRARADVLVTAIGTVLFDDPQMNVRIQRLANAPIKCVVDTWARLPLTARLFEDKAPVWLVVGKVDASHAQFQSQQQRITQLQQAHAQLRIVAMPLSQHNHVDLMTLWVYFYEQHINEVHVEAGAKLNAALLQAGLIDELLMYVAPRLMGSGVSMADFSPAVVLDDLTQAAQWCWLDVLPVGEDLRLRAQKI